MRLKQLSQRDDVSAIAKSIVSRVQSRRTNVASKAPEEVFETKSQIKPAEQMQAEDRQHTKLTKETLEKTIEKTSNEFKERNEKLEKILRKESFKRNIGDSYENFAT